MTEKVPALEVLNRVLDEIEDGREKCVKHIKATTSNESLLTILTAIGGAVLYAVQEIEEGNLK